MTEGTADRKRRPRRDAQLRREAILAAAASCFREQGYNVPLDAIAAEAGVSRATMHRNFRDRRMLAAAVLSREVERLGNAVDLSGPLDHTFREIVLRAMPSLAMFQHISTDLGGDVPGRGALAVIADRFDAILAPLVVRARDNGELAADLHPHDLTLYLRMAAGLLHVTMTEQEMDVQLDVALVLLKRGMRPRG